MTTDDAKPLDGYKTAYEHAHENMPYCPIRGTSCNLHCVFYDSQYTCKWLRWLIIATKRLEERP